MYIEKVLNNNVLLTKNQKGKEVIVMGRGISFNKVVGDPIEEEKIEKVFVLNENEFTAKLTELLNDIPVTYLEVVNEIVTHSNEVLGTALSDNIYLTLTDHIHFAIQRGNNDIFLKNAMLLEIKSFYKKEFEIGMKSLKFIENSLGVKLGEDEASFIALHIVNARMDSKEMKLTMKMTEMVRSILNIVTYHFNTVLDESSINFSRFLRHLQYFSMRVLRKELRGGDEDFLYNQVKTTYANAFRCTLKINEFLENTYQQSLSKDEYVYLTIHIHRVTEKDHLDKIK
ncbi:PRD domain-containing protein [Paenibacillus sp. FSL H7-0943]|jgi:beta-glucoside operon transcriptional antiterminator|uniref:BglG family transcription antiterminator LicT n=1 Tax=Paenibacillus sp. FSL H7-0943 TaxID=2954739 RepID=UPI0030D23C98